MTHRIEESAAVWLYLSEDERWEIDSVSDGNESLCGYEHGPDNSECECEDMEGCNAARLVARNIPLPNLSELYQLLKEYYGD